MGSQEKRTAIYQTNNLSNSNALEHSRNFLSAISPGMPITQKKHTCTVYMSIKSVLLNKKLPHKFVFKPVTTDFLFTNLIS